MIAESFKLGYKIIEALAGSPALIVVLVLALAALGIVGYVAVNLVKNTKLTEALAARVQVTHIDGVEGIKADVKTILERQGDVIKRLETLEDASTRQATDLSTALTEIEGLKLQSCSKAPTCLNRIMHEECTGKVA